MDFNTYKDKVKGGWVGKCAGGILGAPIEGYKRFNKIPLTEELFKTNFANDDLDLQLLWLDLLEKKGQKLSPLDFTEHWKNHVAFPWNEYGIATRNIQLGLDLPQTGVQDNEYWGQSMGSPIRSEIWGMVFPCYPELAVKYAELDSSLDHSGFSVEAEMFLSACAAIAFREDNMALIFKEAATYIKDNCLMAAVLYDVQLWASQQSAAVCAAKIKSKYGDADFTSAPMNIAFTLMALIQANNEFGGLFDSLHLGHDSDCIVATAGALLGIINGYEKIPAIWKERVSEEVLVSAELVGIDHPKTITALTERTCQLGVDFAKSDFFKNSALEIIERPHGQDVSITAEVVSFERSRDAEQITLAFTLQNHTEHKKNVNVNITSPHFDAIASRESVAATKDKKFFVTLSQLRNLGGCNIPYTVQLAYDGIKEDFHKGVPLFGEWLLLGPFMEDDPSLEPMNPKYPDHGMSSLPSVTYMNHDKKRPQTNFIEISEVDGWLQNKNVQHQAFETNIIRPTGMEMDLKQHFYGIGERTLYLVTDVVANEAAIRWLCLGTTAFVSVWINNEQCYQSDQIHRRWPYAHAAEAQLSKGNNRIIIRLDFIIDDYKVSVGLKAHQNKHYHQTQWDVEHGFQLPMGVDLLENQWTTQKV